MKARVYGVLLVGVLTFSAEAQTQQQPQQPGGSPVRPNAPSRSAQRLNGVGIAPPGLVNPGQGPNSAAVPANPAQTGPQTANWPGKSPYGTNTPSETVSNQVSNAATNLAGFGTNAYSGLSNAWTSLSNRFASHALSNRIYITNAYMTNTLSRSVAPTSSTGAAVQDQAATVADQNILINLHRRVPIVIRPEAAANVHFVSKQGVVTLVGTVATERESQRLAELVERTPGVAQVNNQLQVNGETDESLTPTGRTNAGERFSP